MKVGLLKQLITLSSAGIVLLVGVAVKVNIQETQQHLLMLSCALLLLSTIFAFVCLMLITLVSIAMAELASTVEYEEQANEKAIPYLLGEKKCTKEYLNWLKDKYGSNIESHRKTIEESGRKAISMQSWEKKSAVLSYSFFTSSLITIGAIGIV